MSYEECLDTEQRGFDLVTPFLETVSKKKLIWTTSEYDQEFLGDVIVDLTTVEIKTEEVWTGNLFFEIWSNYPIRHGWIYKLDECDVLLYNFLDRRKCYGLPFQETVEWYMKERERFPWKPQKKHTQKNSFHRTSSFLSAFIVKGSIVLH